VLSSVHSEGGGDLALPRGVYSLGAEVPLASLQLAAMLPAGFTGSTPTFTLPDTSLLVAWQSAPAAAASASVLTAPIVRINTGASDFSGDVRFTFPAGTAARYVDASGLQGSLTAPIGTTLELRALLSTGASVVLASATVDASMTLSLPPVFTTSSVRALRCLSPAPSLSPRCSWWR